MRVSDTGLTAAHVGPDLLCVTQLREYLLRAPNRSSHTTWSVNWPCSYPVGARLVARVVGDDRIKHTIYTIPWRISGLLFTLIRR
jgi:hypothetical protein